MNTSTPTMQDPQAVNVDAIQAALKDELSKDSESSRAVQEMLRDPASITDARLLKILADAVAQGLHIPRSASPVCMHAHGLRMTTDSEQYAGTYADGGPSYAFTAIHDVDLSVSGPYYAAGVMITSPKFRLLRRYPPTVFFYVIVDGPYRGVRLCTLAVIESLGFSPEYPTADNTHPVCRAFYTAGEAYHYLHEALLQRGLIAPLSPPLEPIVTHHDTPTASADHYVQTATPETTPETTPTASPVGSSAPLVAWSHVELAWDVDGYFERV